MTTITIDDPKIESEYSAQEIRTKFLEFLQYEFGDYSISLHQISVDDLPKKSKERLDKIDTMNFIDYQ